VVDASVALKWCLSAQDEQFVPQASELLNSYERDMARFVVPDLFWLELANGLWKAVWKQKIDQPWAERAYAKVADLGIPTVRSAEFVPEALQLASKFRRTVYDSLYVVLAVRFKADLITADERLANELAARFPVKWLGAL
jgi:predicted nucleic acid-binding protein